jgi:predicted Zn-dependent peptidase
MNKSNVINVKSKNNISELYLVYKGSVNNEQKGTRGISHLSEHLLATALDDLQDEFQENCIDYNAWTSDSEIVFYISGLESRLELFRDVFIKNLINHVPTQEQFEKERNIVLQELYGYFADQSYAHYMNILREKFNYYGALGSEKDLATITYEQYLEFHKETYQQPTQIVNISKDFIYENDPISLAPYNKEFKQYNFDSNGVEDSLITNCFNDTRSIVYLNKNIFTDNKDILNMRFISRMLNDGLNSPLMKVVREERNLVYSISAFVDSLNDNSFIFAIMTQTRNETVDKTITAIDEVIFNPQKYLSEERFYVMYKMLNIKKQMELERNPTYSTVTRNHDKDLFDNLDAITYNDVLITYNKYFTTVDFAVSTDIVMNEAVDVS